MRAIALALLSAGLVACQYGEKPAIGLSPAEPHIQRHDDIWLGAVAIPLAAKIAAEASPAAAPPTIWRTTRGLKLRQQMALWATLQNAPDCETSVTDPCYAVVERNGNDPVEPWVIAVDASFEGTYLEALTWLRDGFWASPRPEIEVTQNNKVIVMSQGASR